MNWATAIHMTTIHMTRRVFGAAGLALVLATSASFAQQPQTVRVRGTVEAVDGPMLTVKSRRRPDDYKVKMTDNAAVRGIIKAALADIKDNSFIGVTGMPQADGSQKAVEIHIFPEALRGTGEGLPAMGPDAEQHHDQRHRGADGEGSERRRDHAQVQGRRKEDRRRAGDGDRDLRSRRQGANSSPAPRSSSPPPTRRMTARSKPLPSRSAATASRRRCELPITVCFFGMPPMAACIHP